MTCLYPPDYQYGLIYFFVVLAFVIISLVLDYRNRSATPPVKSKITYILSLISVLLSLYFFALPAYL